MKNNPWLSLEAIPGQCAVLPVWRDFTGEDFEAFRTLCLDVSDRTTCLFPCPWAPICAFRIVRPAIPGAPIIGHCETRPPQCEDVIFSETDILPLQVNWKKLARALCKAFGLDSRFSTLRLPGTFQIGNWSADNVPVLLAVQSRPTFQHQAVCELVASLNQKFILFTPTAGMMDVPSLQMLTRVHAEFFPLDTNVILTPNGTLHPTKTPGELFANFRPQRRDAVEENVARQLFALAKTLDSNYGRKATPSEVMRLYCVEGLEAGQIASKLKCARSLVYLRLQLLASKLGRNPSELRQFSSHFEKMEGSLSDARARRIHRPTQADPNPSDNDYD
jgi:hypothetical protein